MPCCSNVATSRGPNCSSSSCLHKYATEGVFNLKTFLVPFIIWTLYYRGGRRRHYLHLRSPYHPLSLVHSCCHNLVCKLIWNHQELQMLPTSKYQGTLAKQDSASSSYSQRMNVYSIPGRQAHKGSACRDIEWECIRWEILPSFKRKPHSRGRQGSVRFLFYHLLHFPDRGIVLYHQDNGPLWICWQLYKDLNVSFLRWKLNSSEVRGDIDWGCAALLLRWKEIVVSGVSVILTTYAKQLLLQSCLLATSAVSDPSLRTWIKWFAKRLKFLWRNNGKCIVTCDVKIMTS